MVDGQKDKTELIVAPPRDLFTAANLKKFEVPWEEKVPTAFFRGTATGGGVTVQNNQRLHVAQVCYDWSNTRSFPLLSGSKGLTSDTATTNTAAAAAAAAATKGIKSAKRKRAVGAESTAVIEEVEVEVEEDVQLLTNKEGDSQDDAIDENTESLSDPKCELTAAEKKEDACHPYLDAKITGWNMRDKKTYNGKMTYLKKANFLFEGDRKKNFVEIYKQGTYKYLMYIEGHCAACRYGFMMQLGSVILKVRRDVLSTILLFTICLFLAACHINFNISSHFFLIYSLSAVIFFSMLRLRACVLPIRCGIFRC